MTGNKLKWIAIVTMAIDHTACVLVPHGDPLYTVMRMIGRLAFPIFCFLISEGVYHTKNRGKYLFRMGLFALLSEIPFDLAFHGKLFEKSGQNVFFTLALGVLGLMLYDYFYKVIRFGALAFPALCMLLASCIHTDYGALGVLMITVCYLLRPKKYIQLAGVFVTNVALSLWYKRDIQLFACAALIPIALYNGKRGKVSTFGQYFFYGFYPLHLLLIWGVLRLFTHG